MTLLQFFSFHNTGFRIFSHVYDLRPYRRLLCIFCVTALICASAACVHGVLVSRSCIAPYPLQTTAPYTIALDAGHGGMDDGSKGYASEVIVCEQTVDALFALLSADPSYQPVRTRANGVDLSTTDRSQVAADHCASLLLSVHANVDHTTRQSHGFECYATPPGRLYAEDALRFANCLIDEMRTAGHRIRGATGIHFLYYHGNRKEIVDSTNIKVRSAKSFGMLEKPACPAVLVEQCFLTNYDDYQNWATKSGCKRAARIYYQAICAYFGTVPIAE